MNIIGRCIHVLLLLAFALLFFVLGVLLGLALLSVLRVVCQALMKLARFTISFLCFELELVNLLLVGLFVLLEQLVSFVVLILALNLLLFVVRLYCLVHETFGGE